MTARLARSVASLMSVLVLCAGSIAGQAPSPGPAAEQSGPKPSPAVEKLLQEAQRLAAANQPADSLKTADQALDAARTSKDKAGESLSQQARAKALQDLKRTEDALAAWQAAAKIWAEIGDAPGQITSLVQAGLLLGADKKTDAERYFAQGLSIAKADAQHPDAVAQALYESGNALARPHYQSGVYPPVVFAGTYARLVKSDNIQQAWDYLNAALAIREKRAPGSIALAETLTALAHVADEFVYIINGADSDKYDQLEKEYSARAVEIAQRLAPDSALLAESLQWLGNAKAIDDPPEGWAEAPQHFLAALQIRRKLVPGGSMEEASILDDLGRVKTKQARTAEALEYTQQAVALGDRLAPDSQEFAFSLEELGTINEDLGDLRAGRQNMERALRIQEKAHAFLGPVYVNLGTVAFYQSDYPAARDYFEKAFALFQTTRTGKFGAAIALENLGGVHFLLGDMSSALEYHKRALSLLQGISASNVYVAGAFHEIANDLEQQGNYGEAADYYQKALAMQEKLVPDSFYVATTLGNLGHLARAQKNLTLAMDYDRRALETGKKACPDSWCVVSVINDVGELAYEQGDLATSDSNFRRAIDMREKNLGLNHPDLARSLSGLALTLAAEGKTSEALADALRAEKIGADHLRLTARALSERQALAYEGFRASGLDVALTLAADPASTPSARSQVFDTVVRSRALVFDELAARHRSAYGSGNPEVMQVADRLFSARARLATLVLRGAGDSPSDAYRKMVDDARAQKESAERQLAEKSAAFRQDQARSQLGLKEISASLRQGTALVAYVRFARQQFHQAAGKPAPEPIPFYAAFLLRARQTEPDFVPLGSADEIDHLLNGWRRDIAGQAEAADAPASVATNAHRRAGAALRRKIWDPLVPRIANATEVFVVPDAGLHLINLAALPTGSAQYLIETGPLIHYLSTERDLLPPSASHGEGILVVGNPAFDAAGRVTLVSRQEPSPAASDATLLRGPRSACGSYQTLRFPPLPASQLEAENVAAVWQRSATRGGGSLRGGAPQQTSGNLLQLTGADASLETFERDAPGRRVLHVATHGFFLQGSCESALQRKLDATRRDDDFLPASAENPLLLSGLAFAGANHRASAKPEESDGILTAEEIAGMNLEGVDWAVLSACNTGVGEVKVGEGVFGLRRAFQVAGAKTVIMSLWPVEDETARQWMGTLYREHFLRAKDTAESVRAASLRILQQRRAKGQSTDPFYWGAFIAVGDWH